MLSHHHVSDMPPPISTAEASYAARRFQLTLFGGEGGRPAGGISASAASTRAAHGAAISVTSARFQDDGGERDAAARRWREWLF